MVYSGPKWTGIEELFNLRVIDGCQIAVQLRILWNEFKLETFLWQDMFVHTVIVLEMPIDVSPQTTTNLSPFMKCMDSISRRYGWCA